MSWVVRYVLELGALIFWKGSDEKNLGWGGGAGMGKHIVQVEKEM